MGHAKNGLILVLVLTFSAIHADSFDNARKRVHFQRNKLNNQVEQIQEKISRKYLKDLIMIGNSAAERGLKEILGMVMDEIKTIEPSHEELEELTGKFGSIQEAEVRKDVKTRIIKKLDKAKEYKTRKEIELANSCFKAGLIGVAYDIAVDTFKHYPQNKGIRKLFGYYKGADQWFRKYEYSMHRKGQVWHEELGWIFMRYRTIYDEGKYILGNKTVTLEQADKVYKKWTNPWIIETEHFIVKSNMPLREAIALTSRLESFYRKFFRYYVGFFNFGRRGAMETLFKMESAKKLTVYYWKDKEDFIAHAKKLDVSNLGTLKQSVGFYYPPSGTSQFYDRKGVESTLYHELTHQILGEYGTKSTKERPVWIVEGIAVGSECVSNNGKFDVTFEPLTNIRMQHLKQIRPDNAIFTFMNTRYDDFHEKKDRQINYSLAGTLAIFFLEYDNGKYREDFVDYLRDVYFYKVDPSRIKIDKYIQRSKDELQTDFDTFLKNFPLDPRWSFSR